MTTAWLVGFALFVVVPAAAQAASAPQAGQAKVAASAAEPATIEFWNRKIAVLRTTVAGANPQDRADRAMDRIAELPLGTRSSDIHLNPIRVGDDDGLGFIYKGRVLFFLGSGDTDKESGQTLADLSKQVLDNLNEALIAREQERSWPAIRRGILLTVLGLALLVAFLWAIWKAYHWLFGYLHTLEKGFPFRLRFSGVDLVPHIAGLIYTLMRVAVWMLTIGSLYAWLTISLGYFPYTAPWGKEMGGYVISFFKDLALAAINALPGLFSCIVIFLITRWIVKLGRAFFTQVASGSVRVAWMDSDVAHATERIFGFVAWIFALVVAYPYIPGSSTEAFKGISVFFGVIVSLGSTGIINQVMSGLFVVYSRAMKTGEWVKVDEKEGEVIDVGLLAVKIRTIEQQEVTVPNSIIVNTKTTNFTRVGRYGGSVANVAVTIGYDAPWRQVHALLLLGAERTANIRGGSEQPYVIQRALSDFYVEYTMVIHLENEARRVGTLSALHANIQDAFNEYGVQIMSPHFVVQPGEAVTVPRAQWFAAPAGPEEGQKAKDSFSDKHFEAGK